MSENKLTKLPLDAIFFWAAALITAISGLISLRYGFQVVTLLTVLVLIAVGVFAFLRNKMLIVIGVGMLTLLRFIQLILSFTNNAASVFISLFYFAASAVLLFVVLSRMIPQLGSLDSMKGILRFIPSGLHLIGLLIYLIMTLINYITYLRYGYGFGFFLQNFLPVAFGAILGGGVLIAAYFFMANNAFADVYKDGTVSSGAKSRQANPQAYQPILQPNAPQTVNPFASPAQSVNPYAAPAQSVNPYAAPAQSVNPYAAPAQTVNPYAAPAQSVNPYASPAQSVNPYASPAPVQTVSPFPPADLKADEPPMPEFAAAAAAPVPPQPESPVADPLPEAELPPQTEETAVPEPAADVSEGPLPEILPPAEPESDAPPAAQQPEADVNPAAAPTDQTVNTLKIFKNMLDQGLITQEEYDAKKKQLLGL